MSIFGVCDVCCFRGVCPTADRCNACIRGLADDSLPHLLKLVCRKFWSGRCHGRNRSACHFYEPNEIFYAQTKDRFNCFRLSDENKRCLVSELDPNQCHCEDNKNLSRKLDESLDGKLYDFRSKQQACQDLARLSRETRVKLHPSFDFYCDLTGFNVVNYLS